MESYTIIKYKWECGAYELKDMIEFVENGILSKQQFFEITRHDYDGTKVNE